MKARYDEETELVYLESEITGAEKGFKRIEAVGAYGDPETDDPILFNDALIMAGEADDGRIFLLREFFGEFDEFVRTAIEWKDRYYCLKFHVPPEPIAHLRGLYEEDGLTKYAVAYRTEHGPVHKVREPQKRWPHFRSRTQKATVLKLQARLLLDFEAARIQVYRAKQAGELVGDMKFLPMTERTWGPRQNLRENLKIPIFRAAIGAGWTMLATRKEEKIKSQEEGKPWPWKDFYRQRRAYHQ